MVRRIWILQEVAAARQILMACGPTQIEGHTFCAGLKSLKLPSREHPDLQGLISVTCLIRGAIFRPKHVQSGKISLKLRPLDELIDMYHTHEATILHDKVYALLGMSSDDRSMANFTPNYNIRWQELMERVSRFALCEGIFVRAAVNKPLAGIRSKGIVLGRVYSVHNHPTWNDIIKVKFNFTKEVRDQLHDAAYCPWFLPAPAMPIQKNDIVLLLRGSSKTTIVRFQHDHFIIVMISAFDVEKIFHQSMDKLWSNIASRDFVLIWDWERSSNKSKHVALYKSLENFCLGLPRDSSEHKFDRFRISLNVGLILEDAEQDRKAESKLQEAITHYDCTCAKEDSNAINARDALSSIYARTARFEDALHILRENIATRRRLQLPGYPDRLNSIVKLAFAYETQILEKKIKNHRRYEKELIEGQKDTTWYSYEKERLEHEENAIQFALALLRNQHKGISISERDLIHATGKQSAIALELLLEGVVEEVDITENVVMAAIRNWQEPKMLRLLLEEGGDEVEITEDVVKAAVGQLTTDPLKILFELRSDEVKVTEDILKVAVDNECIAPLSLILDRRGGAVKITEDVIEAAARGFGDAMELLLNRRGDEFKITEDVVKEAAGGSKETMELLLEHRGDEIKITDNVLKAAAGRNPDTMKLLLDRRGDEVNITEEIV